MPDPNYPKIGLHFALITYLKVVNCNPDQMLPSVVSNLGLH